MRTRIKACTITGLAISGVIIALLPQTSRTLHGLSLEFGPKGLREWSVRCLASHGREATPYLRRALYDADGNVCGQAIQSIGDLKVPPVEVIPDLLNIVKRHGYDTAIDDRATYFDLAYDCVVKLGPESARFLAKSLDSRSAEVRAFVVLLLQKFNVESVVFLKRTWRCSDSEQAKFQALQVFSLLSKRAQRLCIEDVLLLAESPLESIRVRSHALIYLTAVRPRIDNFSCFVASIITSDCEDELVLNALKALQILGSEARPEIPILQYLTGSHREIISNKSREVLEHIRHASKIKKLSVINEQR